MTISFDKALGNFPADLSLYGERSSLLAANIANADTPGFKARDIDFGSLLAKAGGEEMAMKTTHANHLRGASAVSSPDLLYRIPTQPSVDGNTVDSQVEQAEFAENAVRYQSTLTFLNGKFRSLNLAIKGE
ncbi:MAG: flagellar basal body rod protein FlgB [Pseudomonadota bacterium]|nr:flagellar basal body rod protein FlgB [Pseudomonadota bacterium]